LYNTRRRAAPHDTATGRDAPQRIRCEQTLMPYPWA